MKNNSIAVIVAGGSGIRMSSNTPKQFLLLNGIPVLMQTINCFAACDEIIVVLPKNQIPEWQDLIEKYHFSIPHLITAGGSSRYQSVLAGLNSIKTIGIVAVHDGVRPIVSKDFISKCFSEAETHGTAIPYITIPDSMREMNSGNYRRVDRNNFILIQTPQCFKTQYISKAFQPTTTQEFTDDASVLEASGFSLNFINGERWNIKITYPDDLKVAEALIKKGNVLKNSW